MRGKGPGMAVSLERIGAFLTGCSVGPERVPPWIIFPLTGIARAAVLPALIGISAAAPARGDDPVAVRRPPRLHSPGCNDPGPAIVRRPPKSHE